MYPGGEFLLIGTPTESILYPIMCNDISGLINKCIQEAEECLLEDEKGIVDLKYGVPYNQETKDILATNVPLHELHSMSITWSDQIVKAKHLHKDLLSALEDIKLAIKGQ